ncbi:molybdenum cofactor biosynthesis protein MoaA [Candidatus Bathyarchaeota archaeon]|nr:MAG: molybdenum cofactor biosynthesis protein MoaA [Candidatus Bathyarchaeota archaeon]
MAHYLRRRSALAGPKWSYPRFLMLGFKPFDPLWLARETERIACSGDKRKYTAFYATGVYAGIATGYVVGCCLRCFFCWSGFERDFPEFFGRFYGPEEAMKCILAAARRYGVDKARISGGEPTLCREHLLGLLEAFQETDLRLFILETNGILLGADRSYVRALSRFERVHVRVSLKAGTPEGFTARTGAKPEAFELPFRAIEALLDEGVSFHVAAMTDPRLMPREERQQLLRRLEEIDPFLAANLEEEICDPYETTLVRMTAYGLDPAELFLAGLGRES